MNVIKESSLLHDRCLIGGKWVKAASQKSFSVVSPDSQSTIATAPQLSRDEIAHAVDVAHDAFVKWSRFPAPERAALIRAWFDLVRKHADEVGSILSSEQGKPLAEGIGEVHYAASFLDWFSEEAKRGYGDILPSNSANRRFMVLKQPVGVAALITPWNFPAAMITRKAGAALAAGCTVVIKPASQTPLTAFALCDLAERAGIPAGVVNVVTGSASEIGGELTSNLKVRKLSFTGSTEVGRVLLKQCAGTIKNVSMELGGNAPVIVFNDCNIEAAVNGVMASKFRNAGQTCVCANRIYVQNEIYDEFQARLIEAVNALKVGSTFDEQTQIGPLIDESAVAKVQEHIDDAVAKGAKIVAGGGRHELGSTFFTPTVLSDVSDQALVTEEETFGPLAPLLRFTSEDEVIRRANDTEFGLAAYVFTNDLNRSWRMIEALEYGIVGLNEGATSTELGPFGGVKQSGIGREGSRYGIEDYLETKFVNIGNVE